MWVHNHCSRKYINIYLFAYKMCIYKCSVFNCIHNTCTSSKLYGCKWYKKEKVIRNKISVVLHVYVNILLQHLQHVPYLLARRGGGGQQTTGNANSYWTRNQWSVSLFTLNCISLRILPCGHLLQYRLNFSDN